MRRFKIHENGYPYFISASIVKWLPVFVNQKTCDIIINSLNYCRGNKGLRIHSYVIMPTHIHLIVSGITIWHPFYGISRGIRQSK